MTDNRIPQDILEDLLNDIEINSEDIDDIKDFVSSFGDNDLDNLFGIVIAEKRTK